MTVNRAAMLTVFGLTAFTATSGRVITLHADTHRENVSVASAKKKGPGSRERIDRLRARMPLRFERAESTAADFVARGDGYSLVLNNHSAVIALDRTAEDAAAAVGVRLTGASPRAAAIARTPQRDVANYLIGNDPSRWRTGVRGYGRVEYHDVYPGIDVAYYGNMRQLEYDFVIAPGANYRAISLEFQGAARPRIDADGNLVLTTAAGDLVEHAPIIYQEKDGTRVPVAGGFTLRSRSRVGFWIGGHDARLPLVIDPVLTYATYVGGSSDESAGAVAVDGAGNIFVTGTTRSANFPATAPSLAHGSTAADVFVLKLSPAGDQLLYATYLGGSQFESPSDIAVDAAGNAYIVGTTQSTDLPTLHPIQPSKHGGSSDGFVAKLDPNGGLVYSTYLGGSADDLGGGIGVDRFGRAYVTGSTWSPDFPTADAMQPSLGGHALYRTTDGGDTWVGSPSTLRAGAVITFAIDPATSVAYAGTQSDGVFTSSDGGATWTPTASLPAVAVNAIAVAADGTVYVGSSAGLFRSSDGGASWIDLQFGFPILALAVDPASGSVYVALNEPYGGLLMSLDGGETWNATGLVEAPTSIAFSQSVLYAGTNSGVFKRVAGGPWQSTAGNAGHAVVQSVWSLSVNPNDANQLYVGTLGNGLFYSTTGGTSWTSVSIFAGSSVRNVAIAPSAPSIAYVATTSGSGMTSDGGATWRPVNGSGASYGFAVDPHVATTAYEATVINSDAFVTRISADGSALEYSSYLGGIGAESSTDIALDVLGATYVTGTTQSADFPTVNAFQAHFGGSIDVFVAKLSDTGGLVYSTYLAGSASANMPRIAVDPMGQAHVVGLTSSTAFPVANSYQPAPGGQTDVFVTTLNAAGDGLVFSTYLGGSDFEIDYDLEGLGPDVAIGPSGETIVTGATRSRDFPAHNAVQPLFGGGASDAFVARYERSGWLSSATYLGGSGSDGGRRVVADATGAVIVVGTTTSSDFPTVAALQSTNAGGKDVFIARIEHDDPPVDTIAPTSQIAITGTAGLNGWDRSGVQLTLTAGDNAGGSGVARIEYSVGDGVFQRYTGPFSLQTEGSTMIHARAIDWAGNVESPGSTVGVSIDTSAPAITIAAPAARDYLHSDVLQLAYTASDTVSGIAAGSLIATLDGSAVASGQSVPLLTLSLGTHTLSVSATDQAGNPNVRAVTFNVKATIESLIAAVDAFTSQGAIDPRVAHSLQAKLADASQAMDKGNLLAVRGDLSDFANAVSAKSGSGISADAAAVLLADTQYVMAAL